MVKFIPQNIIDDIQNSLDIVDVINSYVKLKRVGNNYKTLCPFHHEKTPSFIVSPNKQIFHCFGCNEGGNIFVFLMKHLRINFTEAAEILAKKAGINIPAVKKYKDNSKANKLYEINKLAAERFHKQLKDNKKVKDYLSKRGINQETISKFKLGFAEKNWESMFNYFIKKGFSEKTLEESGLILSKNKGKGWYDRFRDRIIFPIFDINSKVVAFGARVINDSDIPKYINSPETEIYSKRKVLYGLNFSKDYIRKKDYAIVVEGYTDFITLFTNGIYNVVANSGTALTQGHLRLLKKFTDNLIMVYDSDEAGKLASLRSLDLIIENDMNVKIVSLPTGNDPDTFVKDKGKLEFLGIIKKAKDLIDYKLSVWDFKNKNIDVHAKKDILEDILSTISKVNDSIKRDDYLNKLSDASAAGIREDVLRKSLNSIIERQRNYIEDRKVEINLSDIGKIPADEKILLRAMLESIDGINYVKQNLSLEDFKHSLTKKIFQSILEYQQDLELVEVDRIINHFKDENCCRLLTKLFCEYKDMPEYMNILYDCVKKIELEKLNSKLNSLKLEIKKADISKKRELLFSYNDLCRQMDNLKKIKYREEFSEKVS